MVIFTRELINWLEAHQLPCLVKESIGIECPGCGFQTAVFMLLRGEIVNSVKTSPGLIPLIVFLALVAGRIAGIKKISPGILKITGFVCLIIILISYLLKLITH